MKSVLGCGRSSSTPLEKKVVFPTEMNISKPRSIEESLSAGVVWGFSQPACLPTLVSRKISAFVVLYLGHGLPQYGSRDETLLPGRLDECPTPRFTLCTLINPIITRHLVLPQWIIRSTYYVAVERSENERRDFSRQCRD